MEAGRIGGGETRAAGRGKVGRSGAPVGRDHQYGGTTKKQSKNKTVPQKVKVGQGGPPRWSGVTVRGDTPKCGASRWSAMGVRGLTTQNHFGLDRDRPSHGSRDRKEALSERRASVLSLNFMEEFTKWGGPPGPRPTPPSA